MTIIAGLFTGLVIGLVLGAPAIMVYLLRPQKNNLPIIIDIDITPGRHTGTEFGLSMALHLFMSTIFGGGYVILTRAAALPFDYSALSHAGYVALFYLVVGGILFPGLGLGLMGRREGKYVPLELLMAHTLYGICFYLAANLFFLR